MFPSPKGREANGNTRLSRVVACGCSACVSGRVGAAIGAYMRANLPTADTSAPPFAVPERAPIVLDLPVPVSVNRTRRVNYAGMPAKRTWMQEADCLVMAAGRLPTAIVGPFELTVTMNEKSWRIDPDNGLKELIDFCRRLNLIENDSPRFVRKITMEWGEAPEGCRVTIKPTTISRTVEGSDPGAARSVRNQGARS